MNFKSDNVGPISPAIWQAITDMNKGSQPSYGADQYTLELQKQMSAVFEKDVSVYLTSTGTAANSLALSTLVEPYDSIYCTPEAHINTDECGAPEFYSGGAKLVTVQSDMHAKMNLDSLQQNILHAISLRPHGQRPGCISITQASECGTVYTTAQLMEIHDVAKKYGLPVHMDGARFANSLVKLKRSPAEITWKVGVDVMSFGATKNGAMCAEAVVFFNQDYAQNFDYRHKRAGQLMAKSRFFAGQFLAYLKDDLWIKNAEHANLMATELTEVFRNHNIQIAYPVDCNELFVILPPQLAKYLQTRSCEFYDWSTSQIPTGLYRFVTSCFTTKTEIMALATALTEFFQN